MTNSTIRAKLYHIRSKYGPSQAKKALRRYLFDRQHHMCFYCGKFAPNPQYLTIDHIYPKSKGGSEGVGNLALVCWLCNQTKGGEVVPYVPFSNVMSITRFVIDLSKTRVGRIFLRIMIMLTRKSGVNPPPILTRLLDEFQTERDQTKQQR